MATPTTSRSVAGTDPESGDTPDDGKLLFPDAFIYAAELFTAIKELKNILLVDIRAPVEFEVCRVVMKEGQLINIPEDLIIPGLSEKSFEESLQADIRPIWKKRDTFEAIVLMDKHSQKFTYEGSKLNILRSCILKWDINRTYRQQPVVLIGGIKEYAARYSTELTDPQVFLSKSNSEMDELLQTDIVEYPEYGSRPKRMKLGMQEEAFTDCQQLHINRDFEEGKSLGISISEGHLPRDLYATEYLSIVGPFQSISEPCLPTQNTWGLELSYDYYYPELIAGQIPQEEVAALQEAEGEISGLVTDKPQEISKPNPIDVDLLTDTIHNVLKSLKGDLQQEAGASKPDNVDERGDQNENQPVQEESAEIENVQPATSSPKPLKSLKGDLQQEAGASKPDNVDERGDQNENQPVQEESAEIENVQPATSSPKPLKSLKGDLQQEAGASKPDNVDERGDQNENQPVQEESAEIENVQPATSSPKPLKSLKGDLQQEAGASKPDNVDERGDQNENQPVQEESAEIENVQPATSSPKPLATGAKPRPIIRDGYTGLLNQENICYMNCLVQCLKVIPLMKKTYVLTEDHFRLTSLRPPTLNFALAVALQNLWGGTFESPGMYSLSYFKREISFVRPLHNMNRHQDMFEFFIYIFKILNNDCAYNIPHSLLMNESERAWYSHMLGRSSFLADSFYHQIRNNRICHYCRTPNFVYEMNNMLVLTVPDDDTCQLETLILEYLKDDLIPDYSCTECLCSATIVNQKEIIVEPEVLVIVLQRYILNFSGSFRETNSMIEFPLTDLKFGSGKYKVYAIAHHVGSTSAGHYFATVLLKPEDNTWAVFDDDRPIWHCNVVGKESNVNRNIAGFFYVREGQDDLA